MAYTLNDDTDVEMTRYNEAAEIKTYSGASAENVRGGFVQYDPIRKVEGVYIDLPSGGKLRVGDRPVTPKQSAQTDMVAQAQTPELALTSKTPIPVKNGTPIENILGGANGPELDDYLAAGYTEADVQQYEKFALGNIEDLQVPMKLTPDQMAQYAQQPGAEMIMPRAESLREGVQGAIYNTLDPNREPTGVVGDTISSVLQNLIGEENLDPSGLRAFSGMFTNVLDVATPGLGGAMSTDEGARMFNSGYELMKNGLSSGDTNMMTTGLVDAAIGTALTTLGIVEFAPAVNSLTEPAKDLLRQASPAAKNMLADAIGASRAIAQGDKDMLMEIFQPAGTPRSLGAAASGEPGAIIRPDNVFRGNGPITTSLSVATKPYAVRVTGQSQIDDMVQSGLIRPKEGGYGQDGKAILYFGEMDDAVPNSIFTRPKSDGDKNYTIVADSSKIAGREGPIPLDDVQHIWTMRDGQMIDILDEVKLKNQNFDLAQPQASTAVAPTPVDTSYRMQQQPRGPEDDLPIRLDDLTKSTTGENAGYPADFYSANGPRFYAPGPQFAGDEFGQANRESYKAIMAVRGKPDAEVTIYRAVPDDPKITTINRGDFVTLSPTYAKLHGGSGYGPKGEDAGKILSEKVKVKDIYFDGNDVNEFGYFPEEAAQGSVGKDILELNLKAQPRLTELFKNAEVTADSSAEEIASTLLRAERSGIIDRRTADEILNGMKGQ